MDIRLINKETAESLISKAYRETKKYLKILNTSEDEMFKVFMDKKPALVKAAKDYIRFTNKFSSNGSSPKKARVFPLFNTVLKPYCLSLFDIISKNSKL